MQALDLVAPISLLTYHPLKEAINFLTDTG